jgi:hypothetical protein
MVQEVRRGEAVRVEAEAASSVGQQRRVKPPRLAAHERTSTTDNLQG